MFYRNPLIYGFLFLCSLAPVPAVAQAGLEYSLIVDEKPVGTITITHEKQANNRYVLTQTSHIDIASFWGDVNMNSLLEEVHDAGGGLIQSGNKLQDSDKTYWTKIERSGDEFLAFKSELTNDQQKEDAEAVDLAKGVVAHLVPGAGNVMMIGELLLSDDAKQPKNNRFTTDSFDSSFLNIPYLWQKSAYTLPESLRVFDTEELYIFSAHIIDLGKGELEINGSYINAHQYEMKVQDAKSIYIWLAKDRKGMPYFVKITGHDDGDPYQIILNNGAGNDA